MRLAHYILSVTVAVALCSSPPANAGTPEEAQLGGQINTVLTSFIIAEFGGRTRANKHFNKRPVCGPDDYEVLKEAAKDNATLMDFHARCRLVEFKFERMHVHGFAFLPAGYCDRIKTSIEAVRDRARARALPDDKLHEFIFNHETLRLGANLRLIRSTSSEVSCQDDGSIRFTGKLNRPAVGR